MEPKDPIKDKILKAAISLMNQYGFGALGLSEVAKYAKITKQRIYYHYKAPEEMLIELAQRWGETGRDFTIRSLAATNEVGAYKVLAMCEGFFRWIADDFELAKLGVVLFQSGPSVKKVNQIMIEGRQKGRERIADFLTQEKKFQKMPTKDLEEVVTAIHAQMYGTYFYIMANNESKKLKQHEENCIKTVRQIIDSYLK